MKWSMTTSIRKPGRLRSSWWTSGSSSLRNLPYRSLKIISRRRCVSMQRTPGCRSEILAREVIVRPPCRRQTRSADPIFVEKLIVKTYLWPSMNTELMQDQFAFKPTGSTTAALLQIQHYVQTAFDQGNDYVRCLFIDYSKAFDTVSHPILLTETDKPESTAIHLSMDIWFSLWQATGSQSQ